jgi:hypothetical protein
MPHSECEDAVLGLRGVLETTGIYCWHWGAAVRPLAAKAWTK